VKFSKQVMYLITGTRSLVLKSRPRELTSLKACAGPFIGKPKLSIQAPPLELCGSGTLTRPVLTVGTTLIP
jgi:hypothetical protein